MAKRKAVADPENTCDVSERQTKRVTRSSKVFEVRSTNISTPKARVKHSSQTKKSNTNGVKRSYGRARSIKQEKVVVDLMSDDGDDESDQERDAEVVRVERPLSPAPSTLRRSRRVVMDSVEVQTPSRTRQTTVSSLPASPSPEKFSDDIIMESPSAKLSSLSDYMEGIKIGPPRHVKGKGKGKEKAGLSSPVKSTQNLSGKRPRTLPTRLHHCLSAQKRVVMAALHSQSSSDDDSSQNAQAFQQILALLTGTIERGEGNSCLLLGPPGSGKTQIMNRVAPALPSKPIVIRLSGHVQYNDQLAMREIARQVSLQTGSDSLLADGVPDGDATEDDADDIVLPPSLPSASQLPSFISSLSSLSRPVIIILDEFDLFTGHARQALLYCLFDTVQSCRVGVEGNKGLAVVGVTSRVDVVNLLEKRVKSRFSHRIIRAAPVRRVEEWIANIDSCLRAKAYPDESSSAAVEWEEIWDESVDELLEDRAFSELLKDTFAISRDVRLLNKVLIDSITSLNPEAPYLLPATLRASISMHRDVPHLDFLHSMSYPSLCLLVAANHVLIGGHEFFTFEMAYDLFQKRVKTSSVAGNGGSVGMLNVSRAVMMVAFQDLARLRVIQPQGNSVASLPTEYVKYRTTVERLQLKRALDKLGNVELKKWLGKAQ